MEDPVSLLLHTCSNISLYLCFEQIDDFLHINWSQGIGVDVGKVRGYQANILWLRILGWIKVFIEHFLLEVWMIYQIEEFTSQVSGLNAGKPGWKGIERFRGHIVWWRTLLGNFGRIVAPFISQVLEHFGKVQRIMLLILNCGTEQERGEDSVELPSLNIGRHVASVEIAECYMTEEHILMSLYSQIKLGNLQHCTQQICCMGRMIAVWPDHHGPDFVVFHATQNNAVLISKAILLWQIIHIIDFAERALREAVCLLVLDCANFLFRVHFKEQLPSRGVFCNVLLAFLGQVFGGKADHIA